MTNKTNSLTDEQLNGVKALLLEKYPNCQAIYLFGSFAQGEGRVESDVDFAILSPCRLDQLALINDAGELHSLLGRSVDLVDLRAVSTVFAMQIILKGRRIINLDEFQAELFETHAYAEYAQLQERRGEILQEIKRRGTVYG